MHPRLREVLGHLETSRAALKRAVAAVPSELRGRRPAAERWSVAEVLGHLALVEGQITRLLKTKIEAALANGLGPEHEASAVLPTVDVARLLDRGRRLEASPSARPSADLDAERAMSELAARREALCGLLTGVDGLALGDIVIPNPVLGPLNVYQWAVFVGGHEGRHTAQIEEIAAKLTRPD